MKTGHLVRPDGTINTGKAKHTPAPWEVNNLEEAETVFYIGGQSGSIASAWNKGGGEGEANARLIAAAPDLLEALILAYSFMVTDPQHQGRNILHTIQEAITKATQP